MSEAEAPRGAARLCALLLAALLASLSSCGVADSDQTSAPDVAVHAEQAETEPTRLRVVTRNAPTTWYYDRHMETAGSEHDLVEGFAEARGWEVDWIVTHSVAEVLATLEAGEVQMAAAGLTHLATRDALFVRGPQYMEVTEQVVCHRDLDAIPETVDDLEDVRLVVTAGSSYAETLEAKLPASATFEEEEIGTERLLARVAERELDCTVADSNIVRYNRRSFPHLAIALDLSSPRALGWYFAAGQEDLARKASTWMQSDAGQALRERVDERYFAYIDQFDFVDLRALNRRIEERLPQYREHFEEAAERTQLPADLLAALAYQESHWDPEARSPTGVRGLMMLTERTAEWLEVDRTDPEQSIEGGARYLRQMHDLLDDDIPEPDRTYLALASYNVGRGHLLDARRLARQLGRDPDRWSDLRQTLPLLTEERYYRDLRHGYAPGHQPVHHVKRIRNYRDVIRPAFVDEEEPRDASVSDVAMHADCERAR